MCVCGAEVVSGSIGVNLLGHHRGSVLQGVDRAVQDMALGEKARVNVRSARQAGRAGSRSVEPLHHHHGNASRRCSISHLTHKPHFSGWSCQLTWPVVVCVRYAEGIGDMWGGPQLPPESDLEFDIELMQVNEVKTTLLVVVMGFFSALGCIGVLLFKLLTGVDLTLGLDDDGDEVVGTVAEMDEHEDSDDEEQEEEEALVDPEEEMRRKQEEEKQREEEKLKRANRGTKVEVRTLFSAPALDIR